MQDCANPGGDSSPTPIYTIRKQQQTDTFNTTPFNRCVRIPWEPTERNNRGRAIHFDRDRTSWVEIYLSTEFATRGSLASLLGAKRS